MGGSALLELADVDRAIAAGDPELGALIVRYLAQGDPEPGRPELDPSYDSDDESAHEVDVPTGAFTFDKLRETVGRLGGRAGAMTGTTVSHEGGNGSDFSFTFCVEARDG
ncbi:MAG TPA: hypothetical protein VH143_11745 [Kofleriaceae bacterium]|nr:hypothetical protein [Kofleriaceae bacterium]